MRDGIRAQFVVPRLVAVDLAQPVRGAVLRQPRRGIRSPMSTAFPIREATWSPWRPIERPPPQTRTPRSRRAEADPGTPATASRCSRRTESAGRASVAARAGRGAGPGRGGRTRRVGVVEDRHAVRDAPPVSSRMPSASPPSRGWRTERGTTTAMPDEELRRVAKEMARRSPRRRRSRPTRRSSSPAGCSSCCCGVRHPASQGNAAVARAYAAFAYARDMRRFVAWGACVC